MGQAVARLATNESLTHRGWRFRIAGALVRDVSRCRDLDAAVTADSAAFLRGRYDVVVDVLPGIEPARTLVAKLLGQGVPVVTANKALVAAHGRGLSALAALRGTSFGPATRLRVADLEARLRDTHRIRCVSLRALGYSRASPR